MWPDQVSNPGPLTCESGALPTVLRGPAQRMQTEWLGLYCLLDSSYFNDMTIFPP